MPADCDNHVFHALTPRARREAGRLILSDEAETLLNHMKTTHIVLVAVAIPICLLELIEIRIPSIISFVSAHIQSSTRIL